ncbi:hypothetical protein LIER_34520 [Lithospermum erythrorhizon]|uniref:PH domain-containing protein n=1 Tax=Lithospermum erythrorhizon TaxID=34254 RepID=A0AAV3S3C4_LITER
MGMTGICFLYYKKLSLSLDNGLVHLNMQADLDDMVKWVRGFREIGMYVTHPSRMIAKNMLLLEMYNSLRSKWPKATLKEIEYEEARMLGFEEGMGCKHDDEVEGVTVGKVMLLEWYHIEECEQRGELERGEVEGGRSTGGRTTGGRSSK